MSETDNFLGGCIIAFIIVMFCLGFYYSLGKFIGNGYFVLPNKTNKFVTNTDVDNTYKTYSCVRVTKVQ